MDPIALRNIKLAINKETIKKLLVKYFIEKDIEDFDRPITGQFVFDIVQRIPLLADKIEVVPFSLQMDPTTGLVTLGWNLFVLGSTRLDMGSSKHERMSELENCSLDSCDKHAGEMRITPRTIVNFIVNVLGDNEDGFLHTNVTTVSPSVNVTKPRIGPTASNSFYEKNKPAN